MNTEKAVQALTRAMERKVWREDGWEVPAIDVQEALDALAAPTEEQLLKDLKSARDYSYEANMGDYSMASINHAAAMVAEAKQALEDAGYEVPTW